MTMAVALRDPPVEVVDSKLRALVPTNHTTLVDRLALGIEMTARAFAATPFHIPSPVGVRHHMMCVRPFASCHIYDPFRF